MALALTIAIVVAVVAVVLVVAGFRAARKSIGGSSAGAGALASGPVDRFSVGEPWRHLVGDVQRARTRFSELVAGAAPGPLHDRLADIATRLDGAVQECWRIAQQGHQLDRTASGMRIEVVRGELARLDAGPHDDTIDARIASMRIRIESYERITRASRDAESRLRLLDARLQESAARGGELALNAGGNGELDRLTDEVTSVTDELEALRQALDETGGTPGLAAGSAG